MLEAANFPCKLRRLIVGATVLALTVETPATAGDFGAGFVTGMIVGHALRGLGDGGGGGGRHRHRGGHDDTTSSSSSSSSKNQQKQQVNENAADDTAAIRQVNANIQTELNRNVDAAIEHFVDTLKELHRTFVKASENSNQITKGEILAAVGDAYSYAHLSDFDGLAGELWTRDRLQVQILREGEKGIRPYFDGVASKGADLNNLKQVLSDAATKVYARALEIGDIVGVSHSFDQFIRTIYENSDRVPQNLWTLGADGHYERLLTTVINGVDRQYFLSARPINTANTVETDRLYSRISMQFDFRFRGRRVLFDCLSSNYVELAKAPASAQTVNLIQTEPLRGAQIDIIGSKAAEKSFNASPLKVAQGAGSAEIWERAKKLVSEQCKANMAPLAQEALGQGLKPISARWDSTAALWPDQPGPNSGP